MCKKKQIILGIFLILSLVFNAQAARVYGTIYEWSDLEKPLKNVIIEVEQNSTRVHYNISNDGSYYFEVLPGNYTIKAKYYNNNLLEFIGEENVHIDDVEESRNLDLLLVPPTDSGIESLGDINLSGEMDPREPDYSFYLPLFIVIILIGSVILFFLKKKKRMQLLETNEPAPVEKTDWQSTERELPDDLKELYKLILEKGGRTTQKDLRKEVRYGEAKVSLMVADLESRGLIKKIKKGRSNIIIAENKS